LYGSGIILYGSGSAIIFKDPDPSINKQKKCNNNLDFRTDSLQI
jgi:hypothetical protein